MSTQLELKLPDGGSKKRRSTSRRADAPIERRPEEAMAVTLAALDEISTINLAAGAVRDFHDSMLRSNAVEAEKFLLLRRACAVRLNNGTCFGMSAEGGGMWRLSRRLAAPDGQIPLRGQNGRFLLVTENCRYVVIQNDAADFYGFGIYALDYDRPFISPTGFRSILPQPKAGLGLSTSEFAASLIAAMIHSELKGRFVTINSPVSDHWLNDPALQPGGWLHAALQQAPPPLPMPEPVPRRPRQKPSRRQPLTSARPTRSADAPEILPPPLPSSEDSEIPGLADWTVNLTLPSLLLTPTAPSAEEEELSLV